MSPEHRAIALMTALTFTTGIADAVGFLALDRIFVGNMTGNVIVLGMGVAGGDDLPVLGPVVALLSFVCGAVAAGFTLRGHSDRWNRRTTALLVAGAAILASAAATMFFLDTDTDTDTDTSPSRIAVAAAAALAMGLQATVARAVAVKDMTTVVVTSTLTSFASESLTDPNAESWWARLANRRVVAIVAIFVGAVVGALLLLVHPGLALLTASAVTLAVAASGHTWLRPSPRPAT